MSPNPLPYAARRINMARWNKALATGKDEDYTIALMGNASATGGFSFWTSNGSPEHTADILLALAVACGRTKSTALHIVTITRAQLASHCHLITPTQGATRLAHMRERHIDAYVLPGMELALAHTMGEAVRQGLDDRLTAGAVKRHIAAAIQAGTLDHNALPQTMR